MVNHKTATTKSYTAVSVGTPTFQEWLTEHGKQSWGYDIALLKNPHLSDLWSSTSQVSDYINLSILGFDNLNDKAIDRLVINVLKSFYVGKTVKFVSDIDEDDRNKLIAAKITCRLLELDYDPKNWIFRYNWKTGRKKYEGEHIDVVLREDFIGRCILGLHFGGNELTWKRLVPLEISNLSLGRMKEADIKVFAHDTEVWTLQRRSLIIRKLNPNLQRLLKIHMTDNKNLSECFFYLLVPYLVLIANKKDYQMFCKLKVFDKNIISWKDIERIAITPLLFDPSIVDSLHEISNAIKYHHDNKESNKTIWLYRISIAVAVLSFLTSITSIWAAYQTQRQADAAWATISKT
ncbi:hypothetical protein BC943DRAFT_377312 [Umbelopsis sp. AD052]|nr:hypothetical protein BC943DRAFT_377312 [Umbelopsis sp. AD052]